MKLYIGNTDDRWLKYVKDNKVVDPNFWSGSNYESSELKRISENDEIIFLFKTLCKFKLHKRIYPNIKVDPYTIYGVGKVKKIVFRKYNTVGQFWNDYYTKNGCNSVGELKILLKDKNIGDMCNIELYDVNCQINPINIKDIWRSKYIYCQKGKLFDIDITKPIPKSVNGQSTDDQIGLWIYNQIKNYI